MKTIKIFTNLVYGGWSAKQLETGIGGSEEKLIEWAREMAKENDVTIYMNGEHGVFDNVKYVDHREFNAWEHCDVFISFKNKEIFQQSINADKRYHWTTEVEGEWPKYLLDTVDEIWCISDYHRHKMKPQNDKFKTMYLWADFERMDHNMTISEHKTKSFPKKKNGIFKVGSFDIKLIEREEGSMLYCSSFDRGLEELLTYWPKVKEKLGVKKLYITYGWDFMINLIKSNPGLSSWKQKIEELCKQDGVEFVGRLSNDEMCKMYWKCQYWCLPLNNPDSELFCINAVKAQYAGCIPVVRKIGALQETVGDCINWDEIIGKPNQISTWTDKSIENNIEHVEKFSLNVRLNEWKEKLEK